MRILRTILFLSAFLFMACGHPVKAPEKHPPLKAPIKHSSMGNQIARAYGLKHFHRVEAFRYTFNARIGDKRITRSWQWRPGSDEVVYQEGFSKRRPIRYQRGNVATAARANISKIDAKFINDQYWLLFPFHLVWDPGIQIHDRGIQPLPIGRGTARRVSVSYPAHGGYTPGDRYELFVGKNRLIQAWAYHKAGAAKPTRLTTWEDHQQIGGIRLALDHRGINREFRVWFTDVGIKFYGQKGWQSVTPRLPNKRDRGPINRRTD